MLSSKSTPTESGRKAIASFFMVLLFFVYAVEAMHHHNEVHQASQTETLWTQNSPQCLICDQLQNQHRDLIRPDLVNLPETPIFDGFKANTYYSFSAYPMISHSAPNKDPPLVLISTP